MLLVAHFFLAGRIKWVVANIWVAFAAARPHRAAAKAVARPCVLSGSFRSLFPPDVSLSPSPWRHGDRRSVHNRLCCSWD